MSRRGTTNRNVRGNSRDRARRRQWLVTTWLADQTVDGEAACRCYRCGTLLTINTVTADRIVPGCAGGRYVRSNIRPACATCNSVTGGALATGR